jgi:hypothetical protein
LFSHFSILRFFSFFPILFSLLNLPLHSFECGIGTVKQCIWGK